MQVPEFSIIIPSYNMGAYIGEALQSISAQTWDSWEAIVVEDCGKEDGTAKIVADFARKYPEHRVKFIRHETNGGVSKTRNTAMAAATGNIFAFLDPDDVWLPEYLEKSHAALGAADIAATAARRIDQTGKDLGPYLFGPNRERIAAFPSSLRKANFFNPSFTVIRREVYERIGEFDTKPSIQHAEDWDYWLRALAAGFRFGFLEEELCLYREHSGAATANLINIHRVCAESLRGNRLRVRGAARAELTTTLYFMLVQLANLKAREGKENDLPELLEAAALRPFSALAWKRIIRRFFPWLVKNRLQ